LITRLQVRMARAALGWGVRDLAEKAGLAPNTVSRFENGASARIDSLAQIQDALEKEGIIFVAADATGGPGVRLASIKRPTQGS
jgi:transcriptional regulator with XRE-family HTH domain